MLILSLNQNPIPLRYNFNSSVNLNNKFLVHVVIQVIRPQLLPMELVQRAPGENLQMWKLWNLIFWDYGPGNYLLQQLNEKREKRLEARQQKEGNRGRPSNRSSPRSRSSRRRKYLRRWRKPFTKDDFNQFLSCLLEMSNVKLSTIKDYFRTPSVNVQG